MGFNMNFHNPKKGLKIKTSTIFPYLTATFKMAINFMVSSRINFLIWILVLLSFVSSSSALVTPVLELSFKPSQNYHLIY